MENGGVRVDKWGYKVKTSSDDCISSINSYYEQVLSHGRNRSVILEASIHDPQCVLANVLTAHFLFSSDPSRAPSFLKAANSRLDDSTLYEQSVFGTINYLVSEDRDDDVAVELHSKLLKDFPRDIMSLKRAQILCFYMGRPDLSLDLIQQALPENEQESYIYGMHAFSLLELGRFSDAEKAATRGFEINKQDVWSQHALCHVLQYECRFKEAIEFMEEHSSSWISCSSFMRTHNWWHVALCYLEGHAPVKKVLEVYDKCIWKELEAPDATCAEVYLNALGLLLRLYVRGETNAVEDYLKIVVDRLTEQTTWYLEWHFDILIIWALASTGDVVKAEDLLKGLKSRLSKATKKKQQSMQKGVLLAESIYEYGRGNYNQALKLLGTEFDAGNYKVIGASDEQIDVFNEVWYTMLLKTGRHSQAIEILEKKITKREGVPFMWRLLEKAYAMSGQHEASVAGEKAVALENSYFM